MSFLQRKNCWLCTVKVVFGKGNSENPKQQYGLGQLCERSGRTVKMEIFQSDGFRLHQEYETAKQKYAGQKKRSCEKPP